MKTTSRILAAWMVAGFCLGSANWSWAAPPADAPISEDGPEMTRLKVADLCKKARQAMAEGKFETAESYVSRAEALHANFGLIYFGDSPKKVRRDLDRMRPAKTAATKMPSESFKPQTVNEAEEASEKAKTPAAATGATPPVGTGSATTFNDSKGFVKNYLNKSRAELAQGNLAGAVYWYQKAASSDVQFGPDEDSPQKLAADLAKAGAKLPAPSGEMVAETTPPPDPTTAGRSRFPSRSPFARSTPDEPPAADMKPQFTERPKRPPAGDAQPLPTAAASYPVAASGGDQRAQCDRLLLAARRALAVGDVRRATESVNQAKATGVKYEFHEDSPAKVEAAIFKFNELVQRPDNQRNSESYRRRYAELQMQQAEDLLRWRDFDEAERLVTEAKQLGLNYGPFESNPDVLLARIADGRKHAVPAHLESLPPLGGATATVAANADPSAKTPSQPAAALAPSASESLTSDSASLPARKAKTLEIVRQAREAMRGGDLDQAAVLAQSAQDLGVPDSEFGPRDDRPFLVLLKIQSERRRGVVPVQAVTPIGATAGQSNAPDAMQAVYNPANDPTRNITASSQQTVAPAGPPPAGGQGPGRAAPPAGDAALPSIGMALFQQGEEALRQHDLKSAMNFFRQAQAHREELDPATQQRLQDHLQLSAQLSTPGHAGGDGALMKEAAAAEQVKYRQLSLEISRLENQAKQQQEKDPKRAKATLEMTQKMVEQAQLESSLRELLERRVTRDLAELDSYMTANRGRIELQDRNEAVQGQIDREQKHKVEVQEKLALLVNEYNTLVDQKRYEEAEVVAKRASELAPKEPVVVQLKQQSLVLRRLRNNADVKAASEEGVWSSLHSVEVAAVPFDDSNPIVYPDKKKWDQLTMSRAKLKALGRAKRNGKEMEIESRLKTPVSVRFKDTPLAQVLENLAKLARINLYLDQRGLSEEGVSTDTPVTIDLSEEISLKSALTLILEPLHLSYVIKDEVLKITSEQMRDGEVYTVTYNVADLVIPIPNFVPNGRMGLAGALDDAHRSLGVGGGAGVGQAPLAVIASNDGSPTNAVIDPNVLAQFNVPNPSGGMGMGGMGGMGGPMTGMSQPFGFGPGGAGGGVMPDFDSLIELITGTIAPTTWSEVGGAGAIKQFATNLSLVISQTQEVHEEIADLLEQLRRLQDLQVTIEVRFINLSDAFYEQMGIDLDLDLPSNAIQAGSSFGQPLSASQVANSPNTASNQIYDSGGNLAGYYRNFATPGTTPSTSSTVGITNAFSATSPPLFSQDLSIPISQSSFGAVQGMAPAALANSAAFTTGGATVGFAILSDIQAYFFISAVQSDERTNILQAPKVTLFNGQQAMVSDTAQSPFVISVIPVVGDFAAAQQPVIVVLSSGSTLSVQAVVSSDRRYVRLTVVPFFSSIGTVNTFTFTGSSSSTSTSSSDGPSDATTAQQASVSTQSQGTTVQLPTFAFTTVTTTVSVPDGGTVLLGGIKRLGEQRNENGVPILNKIPYLNRLFNNIATARTTTSLLMMVTPRIIIQEEEEAALGVQAQQ